MVRRSPRSRTCTSKGSGPSPSKRRRRPGRPPASRSRSTPRDELGRLPRPWRPMIGSEHLSHMLSTDTTGGRVVGEELTSALQAAHDELGVSHVRAHAILGDDLGVYREVDGEPVHDFAGVDRVYDHLRSIGMYPVVELSFMPHDLASDPSKTVFEYGAIVSPPKDWQRWHDLIAATGGAPGRPLRPGGPGRALVVRGLERGQPGGLLVGHAGGVPPAVRRDRGRRTLRRRSSVGRRPFLGRVRLGRGAARARRACRLSGRLRQHPHLRQSAAGLRADAGALRTRGHADLVDRVGRHADPLQRGQ